MYAFEHLFSSASTKTTSTVTDPGEAVDPETGLKWSAIKGEQTAVHGLVVSRVRYSSNLWLYLHTPHFTEEVESIAKRLEDAEKNMKVESFQPVMKREIEQVPKKVDVARKVRSVPVNGSNTFVPIEVY